MALPPAAAPVPRVRGRAHLLRAARAALRRARAAAPGGARGLALLLQLASARPHYAWINHIAALLRVALLDDAALAPFFPAAAAAAREAEGEAEATATKPARPRAAARRRAPGSATAPPSRRWSASSRQERGAAQGALRARAVARVLRRLLLRQRAGRLRLHRAPRERRAPLHARRAPAAARRAPAHDGGVVGRDERGREYRCADVRRLRRQRAAAAAAPRRRRRAANWDAERRAPLNLTWTALDLKNLPGSPDRRPQITAPYHYRLDWETRIATTRAASTTPSSGTARATAAAPRGARRRRSRSACSSCSRPRRARARGRHGRGRALPRTTTRSLVARGRRARAADRRPARRVLRYEFVGGRALARRRAGGGASRSARRPSSRRGASGGGGARPRRTPWQRHWLLLFATPRVGRAAARRRRGRAARRRRRFAAAAVVLGRVRRALLADTRSRRSVPLHAAIARPSGRSQRRGHRCAVASAASQGAGRGCRGDACLARQAAQEHEAAGRWRGILFTGEAPPPRTGLDGSSSSECNRRKEEVVDTPFVCAISVTIGDHTRAPSAPTPAGAGASPATCFADT